MEGKRRRAKAYRQTHANTQDFARDFRDSLTRLAANLLTETTNCRRRRRRRFLVWVRFPLLYATATMLLTLLLLLLREC